jgi:hypothetical protein
MRLALTELPMRKEATEFASNLLYYRSKLATSVVNKIVVPDLVSAEAEATNKQNEYQK